jgi:aldose 1-epimerase
MNFTKALKHISNKTFFETEIKGKQTSLFVLQNEQCVITLTNYGARVVNIIVPNNQGNFTDVVCGPNNIADFLAADHPYFGATVGRYANRIDMGKFNLGDKTYKLEINNGENHLHGGSHGLQQKVWNAKQINNITVEFFCTILESEDAFPGDVEVKVIYTLHHTELQIAYEAISNADTIINLTNHTYFNLNGAENIENHLLQIFAKQYTPIKESLIPTGFYEDVINTAFDFTQPKPIGLEINNDNEQLTFAKGYDHNFVLNKPLNKYGLAAILFAEETGIEMQVHTTEPGMQLYTGNFMDGKNKVKNNCTDDFRTAVCLETQHFPDSPNHKNFLSVILKAGEKFISKTSYKFAVR